MVPRQVWRKSLGRIVSEARGKQPIGPLVGAKSALVIMPTWLGDCVMSTPVLRAIATRVETLWLAIPRPLAGLLEGPGAPWKTVHTSGKGLLGPWRAAREIRHAGVPRDSACLLLPNSMRAALTARALGAPVRCGWARDGRALLLTHAHHTVKSSLPTSTLDWYAALGEWALGEPIADRSLYLPPASDTDASNMGEPSQCRTPFVADLPARYCVLNPGGNNPAKRWSADRFARLAEHLHGRGLAVTLSGAPSEAALVSEVAAQCRVPTINLVAGGLTLATLKTIVAHAAILLTNDTGTRHIGLAFGTPTVTLFGPTDYRWTLMSGTREKLLLSQPFLPASLTADNLPKHCTVDRIAVADVRHGCDQLLGCE